MQYGTHGDLTFETGERSSETEVRALTESYVADVAPGEVKSVWIIELFWITVGRTEHQQHVVALAQLLAA